MYINKLALVTIALGIFVFGVTVGIAIRKPSPTQSENIRW